MHAPATINALENRRAANAEAQRILRAHGDQTEVIGADSHVESGFIAASVDISHDNGKGTN